MFQGIFWSANSFFASWQAKMRLGRGGESHISMGRQAMRTHFVLRFFPKCHLGEVEKAMFNWGD
jgi:hypothetical protein